MPMNKDLITSLTNLGLIGSIGGGYKCRAWIQTDGTSSANAYAGPLANALQQLLGEDRVLTQLEHQPLTKLFYGAYEEFHPETWKRLSERAAHDAAVEALTPVGRPYFDLVHLIVTSEGVKNGAIPEPGQIEKLIHRGIGVVLTQLSTLDGVKEMRAVSQHLWPAAFTTTSVVNVTLQTVDDLIYGTLPKDNGRAVLSGYGVLPAPKTEPQTLEGRAPKLGTFIEPEMTPARLGYALALIKLAAQAGWDMVLVALGIDKAATRAIEALIIDEELSVDIDIVDKVESQLAIVEALGVCDATVWLPDGEHAFGQDWRVAIGAALRRPVVVLPSPRVAGYREDAAGAVSFAWADTGQDEISSILYGMDPTASDGRAPYDVWKKRVEQYAEMKSWGARAEEVLVAYAKALLISEDRRMFRILRQERVR